MYERPIWGFTGTRTGLSLAQTLTLKRMLLIFKPKELHLGDCVGADKQAYHLARYVDPKMKLVGHPPSIPKHRAFLDYDEEWEVRPYLERNKDIVRKSTTLIGGVKGPEVVRSGTWSTIRFARAIRKNTIIILRNGRAVL